VGTQVISANASDNVAVVGVQFYLDGSPLGAEVILAPYQISWDTTKTTNGSHTLTAVARDAAGNRTTSAAVNVTVSNVAPQESPYYGTPFAVPGQFEAEDFDNGGEGVAYHDNTPGNQGGLYRLNESVDIISPYAGGYVVNNFETGEWLKYTINVSQSGTYRLEALVSSAFTTSSFHMEVDGIDKTGLIAVPNTGSWGTFQWVGKGGISLSAGQHILRMYVNAQYFNFDKIRTLTDSPPESPYYGTPFAVPGQFEAEDFDNGGEGVAYHDNTPGNQGGQYRLTENVDIISPYPGGYVINNFETGEWLKYTINVAQAGTYRLEALVSSQFTNSSFHMEVDDIDKTGVVLAPNTGSWATFQWVGKGGVSLTAGQHVLKMYANAQYFNLDRIRILVDQPSSTPSDTTPPTVAITAPSSGATVSGTVQVSVSASDDVGVAGVKFFVDGSMLGAEVTGAPYTASWDTTTTANGSHTLTAVARDAAGNNTTSAAVALMVANNTLSTTPPTVAITAPSNGATVSSTVQVTASASDNVGVAGVQFYLDGSPLGVGQTIAPYQISWDTTTTANGSHTLTAAARDAAGNIATSALVTLMVANNTLDTTPPTAAITAPSNGASLSGTVQVSASGSDNVGVAGVKFFVDGSILGAEVTGAPYTMPWDTTKAANGSHMLTAVARDAAGNSTTSAAVVVNVSNASAVARAPFTGTPFPMPGQFNAVDFDKGGEGVAYHDLTPGNQGGYDRLTEDVDITTPGIGYVITDFQTGEWLEYTINVTQSGTYRFEALVSSITTTSSFHFSIDGIATTSSIAVPNTGSWKTFQWVGNGGIGLTAGQHILRITADQQYFNLDAIASSVDTAAKTRTRAVH
jgi:hypothetical protein